MRERTGRREGSCGGGTSRVEGLDMDLYMMGTVEAMLVRLRFRSRYCVEMVKQSGRESTCGAILRHGAALASSIL